MPTVVIPAPLSQARVGKKGIVKPAQIVYFDDGDDEMMDELKKIAHECGVSTITIDGETADTGSSDPSIGLGL